MLRLTVVTFSLFFTSFAATQKLLDASLEEDVRGRRVRPSARAVGSAGHVLLRLLLLSGLASFHSLLDAHLLDVATRISQRVVCGHGVGDEERLRRGDALHAGLPELLWQGCAEFNRAVAHFFFNHRA